MAVIRTSLTANSLWSKAHLFNPNGRRYGYYFNGIDLPFFSDGISDWVVGMEAPAAAPTAAESGSGTYTATVGIQYGITEYNKNTGHESDLSTLSTITGAFTTASKVIVTVPATCASADATGWRIYGSKDSDNTIVYYIGTVDEGTTTFDDTNITRTYPYGRLITNTDGTVTQVNLNTIPVNARYCTAGRTRVFIGGSYPVSTGTATFTNGDATVTFSTAIAHAFMKDAYIRNSIDTRKYLVSSVTDSTHLEMDATYAGSTLAGATYYITIPPSTVWYSAVIPTGGYGTAGMPMPWGFPAASTWQNYTVFPSTNDITGLGAINDQVVVFTDSEHGILNEAGTDFLITESNSKVGCASHYSIAPTSHGTLIFLSKTGVWETDGRTATLLSRDITPTVDDWNDSRLQYAHAIWVGSLRQYWLWVSTGSTHTDKLYIYDFDLKTWIPNDLSANCSAIVKDSNGDFVPYFGGMMSAVTTTGKPTGFVYEGLSGENDGGAATGDKTGTITAADSTSITASAVTLNTTNDGEAGTFVSIYNTYGVYQEKQIITENTGTKITVTSWTTTPTVGYTFRVGAINSYWKSKYYDFDTSTYKSLRSVNVKNVNDTDYTHDVDFKWYLDKSSTARGTKNFSQSYQSKNMQSVSDNKAQFFQFEIGKNTNDAPFGVSAVEMVIEESPRSKEKDKTK